MNITSDWWLHAFGDLFLNLESFKRLERLPGWAHESSTRLGALKPSMSSAFYHICPLQSSCFSIWQFIKINRFQARRDAHITRFYSHFKYISGYNLEVIITSTYSIQIHISLLLLNSQKMMKLIAFCLDNNLYDKRTPRKQRNVIRLICFTNIKSLLSLICCKTRLLHQTPEACVIKVVNVTWKENK